MAEAAMGPNMEAKASMAFHVDVVDRMMSSVLMRVYYFPCLWSVYVTASKKIRKRIVDLESERRR